MMTIRFGLAMVCGLMLPVAALGQALPLPDWKIPEICSKDSATGYCSAFEGRALKTVSGSWAFVPDAIRRLCLEQIRRPEDRSWRVLGDCIDDASERNIDKDAVKTARTPGEAVPAPKPIVIAAPPPPPAPVVVAPAVVPVPAPVVLAPAPAVPAPPVVQPGSIQLPPIPLPTVSPMAALEAEIAQKRAADEAEAKRRAEAQSKAAADAEAKRKADAELQAKLAAETEAKRRAEAAVEAKRKADADAEAKRKADLAACQETITAAGKSGVIRFATGSAVLSADSAPALDRVVAAAKACPNARLSVEGHTDASGDAGRNKDLSNKRAEAVVTHLVKAGIESWRVAGVGVGSAKPIASNDTDEGRAQNRRIEFVTALMDDAERRAAIEAEAKRAAALAAVAAKQKANIKLCQDAVDTAVKSESIRFRAGGAAVTREGAAVLDRVALAVKSCATGKVSIEGHTDATGNADEDKELSEQRAQAVVKYLVRAGIDGKRLMAIGLGRTKPLAANDTDENRAKNRRIEFVVTP